MAPRSCIVMGSGRSGTSMLAGVLAGAGYYMGSTPLAVNSKPPAERQANPKGNFEDIEINEINEELLAPLFPRPARTRRGRVKQSQRLLARGLRWAAALPVDATVVADAQTADRIRAQVANAPFCFKDPRFSHTLPAWRPHTNGAVFLCVFREPARTADSIRTEWARHPRAYEMTHDRALAAWRSAYRRILDQHRHEGEWMFLHYDQILDGSAIPRIESFLDAAVDPSFPEPALKRSQGNGDIGPMEREMYEKLCELAGE